MSKLLMSLALVLLVLTTSGCSPKMKQLRERDQLEQYSQAAHQIPPLAAGFTRLFIYRPHVFVGLGGNAIVIINGHWIGDRDDPIKDNKLIPGTVFVVDVPSDQVKVWWYQNGKEDFDKAFTVSSTTSQTHYLRWSLKPTYGYLDQVDQVKALEEISQLQKELPLEDLRDIHILEFIAELRARNIDRDS